MSQQIAHAVKWSSLGIAARFALQMIAQIILARILGPDNYGLFGLGLLVYSFGNFFSSFGFGRQLLQKQVISDQDIRFAFTWQVILGGLATAAILVSAPAIAAYFDAPKSLPVIQWLSLACLLNAANAPAANLLQRDLDYKTGAKNQFIAYFIGYLCAGIPLALAGFGVNALVIAWLLQAVINLVLTYIARPHSLKLLFWFKQGSDALHYGGLVFITNIINWMLTNLDRVVIGRLLSIQSVGFYTAAMNLASTPNNLMLGSLQTIFLTSGSKVSSDRSKLAVSFQQVLAIIFVLVLPFFVFLSTIASEIVAVLYGATWTESGAVLAILFLVMPAMLISGLSTPILWNTDRRLQEFALQIPILIAGAGLLFSFAHDGLITVSWLVLVIYILRAILIAGAALRALELGWLILFADFLRGIVISGFVVAIVKCVTLLTANSQIPLVTLVLSGLFVSLTALVLLFVFPSAFGVRTQNILSRFFPALIKV
jgi:O-antigen/teichoic acid export membrane protein